MKKKLFEKTILRELLHYDPLDEAERATGKSYKGNMDVSALGFRLMTENSKIKKEFLNLNDDTLLLNELNNYLRIVKEEGFKIVMKEDFTDGENKESLFVLWNNNDGILLSFDTYGGRVNGGCFYYNWKPKFPKKDWCGVYTESGGLNVEHNVWVGHHDCREALRLHLSDLRENGTFVKPWIEEQFLWLMHYGDTKDKNYDYEAITAKRIAKLPRNVRKVIGYK